MSRSTQTNETVTPSQPLAGNPLVSMRPADLASSAGYLLKAVGTSPLKAGAHVGGYLKALRGIVAGNTSIAPDPKDKRFVDPAWQSNAFLRALLQSYLAGQAELTRFIEATDLAPLEKKPRPLRRSTAGRCLGTEQLPADQSRGAAQTGGHRRHEHGQGHPPLRPGHAEQPRPPEAGRQYALHGR